MTKKVLCILLVLAIIGAVFCGCAGGGGSPRKLLFISGIPIVF